MFLLSLEDVYPSSALSKLVLGTMTIICFCIFNAQAATIFSKQSGDWDSTSTWVCKCVPKGTDDVIIQGGHNVSLINSLATPNVNNLSILVNGELSLFNRAIHVHNDLLLDGEISGGSTIPGATGVFTLGNSGQPGSLDGSGTFQYTEEVILIGDITVLPTANLNMVGGDLVIAQSISGPDPVITNKGTLNLGPAELASVGTDGTFINQGVLNAGSEIFKQYNGNGILDASFPGNLVNYSMSGTQKIRPPLTSYYHLHMSNIGLRYLEADIDIDGDLKIYHDTYFNPNQHAISIGGNWEITTNVIKCFADSNTVVTFDGSGNQSILNTVALQRFHKLVVNKPGGTLNNRSDVYVKWEFRMDNGHLKVDSHLVHCDYRVNIYGGQLEVSGVGHFFFDHNSDDAWKQLNGTVAVEGGVLEIGDYQGTHYDTDYNLRGGNFLVSGGAVYISDCLSQTGGSIAISGTGTVYVRAFVGRGHGDAQPKLNLQGGNFSMSDGTVYIMGAYSNKIAHPAIDLNNNINITGGTLYFTKTNAHDEDYYIQTRGHALHHVVVDR